MTQETQSALTPEVRAMIGVSGDVVEAWGVVDAEYLRRFTQAVMDPDPRYWDREFAESTHYGEIITPPIMVSYLASRIRPDQDDPVTRAFEENPESDGIGSIERPGELPPVPTDLVRVLNAGNELAIYQYPQHWGQGLFPEQVLGYSGTGRPRWKGLSDHNPRDHLPEPERRTALHHPSVDHTTLAGRCRRF